MENQSNHLRSVKRAKIEATILNEWFLSLMFVYLNMREIVTMDTAICNKLDRDIWLACISKDADSVPTKIQPYLTKDRPIEWCSKKHVQFRNLKLNFNVEGCSISPSRA